MGDLTIRVAGSADAGSIAELRQLWGATADDPAFAQRIAEWMQADGERRTTWLAEDGGTPAGMASLFEYRRMPRPGGPDARWGYVGNVFVREERRGRGIGTALMQTLVAESDARGYVRLVLSPSAAGVALFRRAGFVPPGEGDAAELLVRPGAPNPRG